jgi:hypothetical protein
MLIPQSGSNPSLFRQLKPHRLRLLPTARTESSMEHSCSINNITEHLDLREITGKVWERTWRAAF